MHQAAPTPSRRRTLSLRHVLVLFLCYCLVLQPNAAFANPVGVNSSTPTSANNAGTLNNSPSRSWNLLDHVYSFFEGTEAAPAPVVLPVDAAVSRKVPVLSNGRVEGNLRVYTGQDFSFDGGFVVTNETYVVGTPNVTVATNATFNAGTIDESGSPDPSGYTVAINGTSRLVGKIHRRSDPLAFPADIPASVPQPTGTRTVIVNTTADLANIGSWSTLKDLHVNKSNETINVPAGNYGAFSVTGSTRLNFTGGVYNFSEGFAFASNASIKVTGVTTINIGTSATISNTGVLIGENTLPGDIKINVLGSNLSISGNATIKALVRVPNGTASVTGSSQVRGQVIADKLEITTNANVIGDTSSNAPGDTTAPTITITSPANNEVINSPTVTVTGTGNDPGIGASGISSVLVNNVAATYNPSTGNWSLNVALNFGPNTITVRATDGAGNTSADAQIVVVRPQDTTPPTVAITSPANNSPSESSSITVSGTMADTGANATGVATVTVNGSPATLNLQAGTWTIANVSLPNTGSNDITAVATDNAGNVSQPSTITVNRQNPQDTAAPTITITAPSNNFTTPNATITVTGTAVDDGGANATGVSRVVVNGQQASYNSQSHEWTINISLTEGSNTIDAYAEDSASPANRSTTASINVIRHTPDTTPPTVTITSPLTSLSTFETTVSLAGTAEDNGLNATGVQSVTVNGTPANYNPATHQWSVSSFNLALGQNHIVVVAVDGASPPNQGQATVDITRRQLEPPTLIVTNPLNAAVVSSSSITVAGSVSSDLPTGLSLKINDTDTPITGGQFARTLQLTEGPNPISVVAKDGQGQETHLSITVMRDVTAPAISFVNIPSSVQPGGTYQILVNATDNIAVADVELRLNGQKMETLTTAPYQFTLSIPAAFAPGATLVLSAVARDLTNTTTVATAQLQTAGPGGISGYVFDDTTGYVVQGVNALLNGSSPVTTDELGIFSFISSTPAGVVRLSKDGYTPVERLYKVAVGEGTALFDTRLTPLDSQANAIGAQGGTISGDGGRVQVNFVAGALSQETDLRVTSVSPQGLANLLPYGWSPVPGAIVDIRTAAGSAALQAPAHLTISTVAGLTSATPLTLVRYDETTHLWTVIGVAFQAAAGGALSADLPGLGQYAFLVADTGTTAPPAPVMGQPLPSSPAADSAALDSAQATAESSPRTAAFSAIAKSSISFSATAPTQLPSGVSIEASFGETYNLLGGKDPVLVDRPAQDFVLYAYPAAATGPQNRLGAFFIAKPTRTNFSITELFNANVHVEIRSGRQNKLGALIDNNGGTLRAGDGSQLLIPANAVSGSQSVFFDNVATQSAGVSLPAGYEVLAAFDVDLGSASLNSAAAISVPELTGDLSRVVVAQLITVGGQRSPKVVARAVVDGENKLTSTTAIPPLPAGVALNGIRSTGRYVFIRVPAAFGYVKGTITDAATSSPQSMVRVSNNQTPFVDLTGSNGQYVLIGTAGAAPTGVNQIGAAALSTDATGTATASLEAQDAVANANIALNSVALQVESISPASGAQNMIATTPVTVTFNKPIAAQTLTGSNFTLSTNAGNPVLGNITVLAGSRVVVFTPAATLAASTTYKVSVTTAVRDIYGHALGTAFNSAFTTAATVVISNRLKPEQITINYPDATGMSTISIPAGSVPDGSNILVINTTSGSTLSTVAGTGALSLQIEARVGDEIALTISQPDGTQYRVVQAAYRRADGFVSVGSNGGTVTSDNGQVLLAIPAGAIQGQADLKLTTTAESDITIPRTGEMDPANVPFGAGVRITVAGSFTNTQELHLEIAAPPTATEGQRVVFMKPAKVTEAGVQRDVWEVVTSGKVEGGKFKTMSPPFTGVTIVSNLGFYDVNVFMPRSFRAVTGTVSEKVNAGGTRPLAGVLVFVTGVSGNQIRSVMATTAANGQFGVIDYEVASADSVIIEATDSLGRKQTAVATPFLGFSPSLYTGLNGLSSMFTSVVFPSSEGLPETLPALLRTEGQMLDLEDGQVDTLQAFGRVAVGSHVQVKVNATPDVKSITGKLMVSGAVRRELIWRNPNPGSGSYETDFTVDGEGAYTVAATTYTQANVETTKATANFSFIGLSNPNTRPSIPGAPFVLSVTPRDQAQQVDSGTRVHLEFSEPVKNLVAGTSVYLTEQGRNTQLGGTILSGGIPVGATTPNISSIDFIPTQGLKGGKTYTVHVTTEIRDSEDERLDQSPEDLDLKPFTSTFTTFEGLVLTTEPPTDNAFRIAAAGELAATVQTDFSTPGGSNLTIYDMSDPQHPKAVSQTFVPQRAIGIAMAELAPEDKFGGSVSPSTIVVITTIAHPDLDRANNLWVYNVDAPEQPVRIGVASLSFPNRISEFPSNLTLKHKRAYIGNTASGGLLVVDLEAVVQQYQAVGGAAAVVQAVLPNKGFNTEAQRQKAKYGTSRTVPSPIFAASVIDQVTVPNEPAQPVAYVASNKQQLISFRLDTPFFDGRLDFADTPPLNGFDDRVLAMTDLIPAGFVTDLRAVSKVLVGGVEKDLAIMLGQTRLWIYDVTFPADPQYLSSPLFTDLGGPSDYARRIEVEGTLAYVMFSDRVVVIDFHDPANPIISSTITGIGTNLRWVTVKDGFVYTLSGEGHLNVSIGRAASLVLVHGYYANATQTCGNPVVIDRQTRHMAQPAEVFFQVFGHDVPQNPRVIIRKTIIVGDQPQDTVLATLPVTLAAAIPNVVVGSAIWPPISDPIDSAAIYTAEVVLDENGSNEFHSRREPIPFSFLIDQYQEGFGVTSGQTSFSYLLGGDATVDFKIDNRDVLTTAGETKVRNFGSNQERTGTTNLPGTIVFNPALSSGTYAFTLRATLNANSSVSDEVHGFVTVDANRFDARLPGSTVINGVELSTGNLGISVNDLEIKNRGLSLSVVRSYNSAGRNSFNPFGYGWRHNYQVVLQHIPGENGAPGAFMLIGGEGSGQIFNEASIQANGRANAESPYQGTLTKVADGFDYFTKGHVKYHFIQAMDIGSEAFFDFGYMGNLTYIEEPNGNRITFSYDTEGRMVRATDSSGRSLTYEYELAETPLVGSIDVVQNATSCQSKARLGIMRRRFLQAQVGKAWHITKIAGPGGVEIEYEYDPVNGNLTGVKRLAGDGISQPAPQNYAWSYEYNPTGQANPVHDHLLKSVTSPNSAVASGHKTTYEYRLDQFGQPVGSIQLPEGVTNTYNYTFGGAGNQITQAVVTDGLQQSRTYTIDRGRVVRILEPRGAETQLTWNDKGNKTLEIDPEGRQTATHYDSNGNPDSQTVTGGNQTISVSTTFDPTFGKPTSVTDGNRNTTTYSLDARGNITRVVLPNGRDMRMEYAANGDLQRMVDQYGFVTTYQYDTYGNTTSVTRQTQTPVVEQQTFDVRSRLLTSQGTIAPSVTNTYDAFDRIISQTITDPSGIREALAVAFTYLPEGQVTSVSQTGGTQSFNKQNTYDGLNRLIRVVESPNGAGPFTLNYTYDQNSNLLTETDRRGVTITRTYDALNFPTSETLSGPFGPALAVTTATEIDRVGNPLRVKNVYNQETSFEYDGFHRLTKRHLPGGFTEETSYDANGNVVAGKDRNGRETTGTYDSLNRPATMRDPAGRITTWTYDDATRTTTIQRDPQGLTERMQSDGLGRLVEHQIKFGSKDYSTTNSYNGRTVQTKDPRGTISVRQLSAFGEPGQITVNGAAPAYSVQMAYGPFGGLKRSVDANGRATTYSLDGLDRATQISRPGSFTESFSYDGAGNVLSRTDLRGIVSQRTYDNLGRPLVTTVLNDNQPVAALTIAYQDALNKETRTDAKGNVTTFEYDGLRRLTTLTNADNKPRTLQYDGMNLRQESDFKGVSTSYVYDAVDRVTQITDRLGQITNIANSDSGGFQKTITNRRGNKRIEVYDPLQRLLSVTDGGASLVSYEYDENSNRIAMTDGRSNRTTYEYDNLNRVTAIKHPANLQTETFAYDAAGNVTTYNDGAGGDVIQTYDEINQLKTRDDGAGNVTKFKYDGGGLLLEKTEPKGGQTIYTYNGFGSLKQVKDADGKSWVFEYDPAQNLQSIKDALGRTVIYDYDSLNRLQSVTQPQTLITTYGYDANSNRVSVNDPQGHITSIGYDALDRAQSVNYTNASGAGPRSYSYGYDPEGNLTSVNETTRLGASTTTRNYARSYDERNRLTKSTDPFNHSIRLGYDNANNISSIIDAETKETRYGYDALNRLQSVTLPDSAGTINYQWQADGLLKQVAYPAGMRRDYTYDAAGRVTNVNNHISGTESEEFAYTYDANANRTTETRRLNGQINRNIAYDYDLLDRLISANYTSPGQRPANPPAGQSASYTESTHLTGFGFNEVGNRTTATTRDRTTTITLTTDNNGVTTESRQDVDQPLVTTTAQFDQLNRLTQLSSDAAGSVATTYGYDRNGNLTSTSQNNQVTASYEYDCRDQLRTILNGANQELASYDYSFERQRIGKTVGGVSLTYVYGGDQVVNEFGQNNQLLNRYDLGGGDVVRAELGGEGERYYFSDAQGSVTSLARTQTSASVTARYEYDAWGQYLGSAGASFNSIGYTGQRADSETGLMPLGNGERYYSPVVGSFIQQDSFTGYVSMPASLNRYSYVHDNPVRYTDPSGHIIPLLLLVGAAAIALTAVTTGTIRAHAEHNLEGDLQRWEQNDPRRSWGSAFGDGTGMTKVVNWASQQDVYTGRDLSLSEARWQGALGAIEVIGNATAVGGLAFKGGSLTMNLARGSEEAYQSVAGATRSLTSFQQAGNDLRAVGSALRHPIQTGKAVASSVSESYSAIGGARGALKEAWTFTREEALPRLNPRNYTVERQGWNVSTTFRGSSRVAPGEVNFMLEDDNFFKFASKRKDVDPNGVFDVIAHGEPDKIRLGPIDGDPINHRLAAKLIKESPGYEGQPIRLLSCNTGRCDTGFAQNLANKMGVPVEAPDDLLWAYSNGKMVVAPRSPSNPDLPDLTKLGSFRTFTPGKSQ